MHRVIDYAYIQRLKNTCSVWEEELEDFFDVMGNCLNTTAHVFAVCLMLCPIVLASFRKLKWSSKLSSCS